MDAIETCHVRAVGYEGQEYASRFHLDTPLEEWECWDSDGGYGPEKIYAYSGQIHVGDTMMDGGIQLAFELSVGTEHWSHCDDYFYTYGSNGETIAFEGYSVDENLPFMTKTEAMAFGKAYLEDEIGMERVEPIQIYSYSHEGLAQYQLELYNEIDPNMMAKPQEIELTEWTDADDCYLIEYEHYFGNLPLLSTSVIRKDDAYMPLGISYVGCTKNGVEYVMAEPNYVLMDSKKTEFAPLERIFEELKRKFDMAITGKITLDEMKLIYFPFPTQVDPDYPYEFDLLPVWQFRFSQGAYKENVYINAADGNEVSF